ncbi:MAG: hypothetical protein ACM3TR_18955 [Caulobacteraceae bacterium]
MKNSKWYISSMLLIFLAISIFYFTYNKVNNIVINCNLEIDDSSHKANMPYNTFIININTEINHVEKYKSIHVDYPDKENLGQIAKYIISSLESETNKDNNDIYIKRLELDVDPQGMDYQKIKELLMNQFIDIKLESINGKESIKKYSIGKLLKDKTNLQ